MTATAVKRIFNFSAGPAILPVPVLEQASKDILTALRTGTDMPKLNLMPFLCGAFTIVVSIYMLGGGGSS